MEIDEIYDSCMSCITNSLLHDPVQTIKTAVHGAINMLDLQSEQEQSSSQASTSEVYGDPEVHPQDETYWGKVNPIGIRSVMMKVFT